MTELVCEWCGAGSPAGSAACQACGASFEAKSEKPPEQQTPQEPSAQPEPVEELTQQELPAKAAAEPAAQPPVSSAPAPSPVAPPQATPEAALAPSGDTPSIADLVPCPNPGCFGVVAPGDGFCTFCGGRLPAPPTAPPEPLRPASSSGAQPPGGGFHIPRGVWIVLAIIPLGLCALIAAVVLNAIGAPGGVEPGDIPEVQKEAERVAWPSGTPTRAPSATPTATGTPTATATPATAVKQPTASDHATYTPVVPNLPANANTVPVSDNVYTGARVYAKNTREYMFQIVGRATDCPIDPYYYKTNAAIKVRRPNGREEWIPETQMLDSGARDNWAVPADDPALKGKQLTALTGCK